MGKVARGVSAPVLAIVLLALGSATARAADYDFTVTPDPPNAGQPATLSAVPEPPSDAVVTWDLDGEGGFEESGAELTHTFTLAGPVDVRMRVTEGDKRTTVSKTLVVNAAPAVDFGFTPAAPLTGQDVLFSPTVSDPEGDAVSLTWSFGDGGFTSDTAPSHVYGSGGTYGVVLTATDVHGGIGTAQHDVPVTGVQGPAPPPEDPSLAPPAAPPPAGSAPSPAPVTAPTPTPPAMMRPFPIVRIAGVVLGDGAVLQILSVRAPRGSSVRVRCRGRGCPVRSVARTSAGRVLRFHRFERRLRAGIVLELFVRKDGRIGKYTRFLIRAEKPPARIDRCLMPGRARPVNCP